MAHQPADAAAEREPADAGVRDLARRHREPVLLRRGVELAEQRAAADAHDAALAGRRRPRSAPRRSMHSAPSRTERPETECPPARIVNGSPAARAARIAAATSSASRRVGDGRRAAVDRAVPAGAGVVVVGVAGLDDAADEAGGAEAGGEGEVGAVVRHATTTVAPARAGRVGGLPYPRPLSGAQLICAATPNDLQLASD